MGRRKNRHCQSKQEVLQRELERRQQAAGKPVAGVQRIFGEFNAVKPAMEQARRRMREKNRRERKNDVE